MDEALAKVYANNLLRHNKWMHFVEQFTDETRIKNSFPAATFELTAFCTLKCPMCFVRIEKEQASAMGGKQCTAREWIKLAEMFRDQGGIFLLLTGGEPMLRPDFPEIYEAVSKLGLYTTLFTNGTTVDDKMLDLLKKRPPASVGITIYGASEETYQKFGGSAGSFRRAIEGLDRLLTLPNIEIDVKFNACKENYKDIKSVYELIAKRNKLISLDYGSCAPTRGACSDATKLRLTKSQIKEINDVLNPIKSAMYNEYKKLDNSYNNDTNEDIDTEASRSASDDERAPKCRGGTIDVYIAWDGRMYPCDMASYPYTFPLEQGFYEAAVDVRRQFGALLLPNRCLSCQNKDTFCACIPKAQNEMRDAARRGERCNYVQRDD